ncbi:hypothetical protein ABB55_24840 [Prosthecomicrobium hirschii]|uniref:PAS domain-containing protein n=2 Tax=Prosthecodimorpha hirschii TaxID=665126 RepID=A0A0P6VQJ0_9HYPH|nr:hypothetical protein ABB55_24840 [Prosthecomicrobium hirschii]
MAMVDREALYRDIALSLDVGYWMLDCARESIYWPKGLGVEKVQKSYGWTPLGEVAQFYDEPERLRFFGYVRDLLANPNSDRRLDIVARGPAGARIPLRMCGRAVRDDRDLYVFGVIEVSPVPRERDDAARQSSALLDSVLAATDSGVILFDEALNLRRANGAALQMFAPAAGEGPAALAAAAERLPADMMKAVAEAFARRAGTAGRIILADGRRAMWRATPYWLGPQGPRGGLLVVNAAGPARAPAPAAPAGRFDVLENLAHPAVVVSATGADLKFANRPARQMLHLADNARYRVRNLFEVAGPMAVARVQPPDPRADILPVALPMGARIARMGEPDDDLLFVEYLYR